MFTRRSRRGKGLVSGPRLCNNFRWLVGEETFASAFSLRKPRQSSEHGPPKRQSISDPEDVSTHQWSAVRSAGTLLTGHGLGMRVSQGIGSNREIEYAG